MGVVHRWYVSIERVPGKGTWARFGHQSPTLGHQIWDELPWPITDSVKTEREILSELYAAVMDLMEQRA